MFFVLKPKGAFILLAAVAFFAATVTFFIALIVVIGLTSASGSGSSSVENTPIDYTLTEDEYIRLCTEYHIGNPDTPISHIRANSHFQREWQSQQQK